MTTNLTTPKKIYDKLGTGVVVTATDLDIRDLSPSSDSILTYGYDYVSNLHPFLVDSSGHLHVDVESGGGSVNDDFMKYLSDNGTRKILHNYAYDSTVTMYTVPSGKKFYLVAAQLSGHNTSNVLAGSSLYAAGTRILYFVVDGDPGFQTESISFPVPLVLSAGETIQVRSDAQYHYANAQVVGYEIDA